MSGDIIRVVLADDYGVVRAGLKAILLPARDIEVVGEASNGREAVELVARLRPDVVAMDLSMPEMNGAEATSVIMAAGGNTRVLILTMHAKEECLVDAMRAGAAGYLLKTDAARELTSALRAVAYGDAYVRPAAGRVLAADLMKKPPAQTERERYEQLTERERAVLRLVGLGYTAPEIGERLFISPKTVDTYKHRIQEKLELTHRSHYVQFALKLGLLSQG